MDRAISEEELDGILDRERVFASSTTQWGDKSGTASLKWGKRGDGGDGDGWDAREGGGVGPVVPLPREGDMYDVIDEMDSSVLSAMT